MLILCEAGQNDLQKCPSLTKFLPYGDLSAAGRSGEAEINDSLEPGFLSEPFLVDSHLQLEVLWFLVVIEAKGGFASCPTP